MLYIRYSASCISFSHFLISYYFDLPDCLLQEWRLRLQTFERNESSSSQSSQNRYEHPRPEARIVSDTQTSSETSQNDTQSRLRTDAMIGCIIEVRRIYFSTIVFVAIFWRISTFNAPKSVDIDFLSKNLLM